MNQHSDDLAVDKFAAATKEKLALARAKGRSGWDQCNPANLSAMLHEHVAKGDPLDVANFCMFLWNLGQPITPCKPIQAVPVVCLVGMKGSAFDAPETKRAYTYSKQPGNGPASRLGDACLKAMGGTAGDSIDRGLLLLKALQDQGFGVFDLGAEYNINPAPAVAQSWELNEETAKFLADLILANDEPTPVTLSVGFIKDDDGKIQHGLRVHESEYPEEGAELLVESTPSPQKAPPAEVVRELVDALGQAKIWFEWVVGDEALQEVKPLAKVLEMTCAALAKAKEHGL